jgi:hypothetical protein
MRDWKKWLTVVLYAAAMAWVEAAVVVYLRTLIGRLEPYQLDPLPNFGGLGTTEVIREVATMVMLLAVGWLAGRNARTRLSYAMLAFGVWDILYYVFLAIIGPWPHSLADWDILFLIPLPWWGPVAAPAAIAMLMATLGTLVTQFESEAHPLWPRARAWAVSAVGSGLALYAFMADALRVAGQGAEAIRNVLPTVFNWPVFGAALVLLAMPVADMLLQLRASPNPA